MADDKKPEDQSEIAELTLPITGFASKIPPYLLEGKTEAERFILTEVSKFSEFSTWAAKVMVETHLEVRKTNGRVRAIEAWKSLFTSWYGFAGAVLSVIGGIAGLIIAIQTIAIFFKT
jgi:hypothetical protein